VARGYAMSIGFEEFVEKSSSVRGESDESVCVVPRASSLDDSGLDQI
jgi:hypothetical protein